MTTHSSASKNISPKKHKTTDAQDDVDEDDDEDDDEDGEEARYMYVGNESPTLEYQSSLSLFSE